MTWHSNQSGFTIVELLIVMIVLTILTVLSTIAVSNNQVKARDRERMSDVQSVANGLELRYKNGNTKAGSSYKAGSYPSHTELFQLGWNNAQTISETLPGTTPSTFTSPTGREGLQLLCIFENPGWSGATADCATVQNATAIRRYLFDTDGRDGYIYEPINRAGTLCYDNNCVRYNLYYRNEEAGSNTYVTLPSKNQ